MAFSGSAIKQGERHAVVYATGANTFFGRAANLIGSTHNVANIQKVSSRPYKQDPWAAGQNSTPHLRHVTMCQPRGGAAALTSGVQEAAEIDRLACAMCSMSYIVWLFDGNT